MPCSLQCSFKNSTTSSSLVLRRCVQPFLICLVPPLLLRALILALLVPSLVHLLFLLLFHLYITCSAIPNSLDNVGTFLFPVFNIFITSSRNSLLYFLLLFT